MRQAFKNTLWAFVIAALILAALASWNVPEVEMRVPWM